jgi:hypothetical protein
VRCIAVCSCFDGFGGEDCHLTTTELYELDQYRSDLCSSLLATIQYSYPSSGLLDSIVSALQQSFNPFQVKLYNRQTSFWVLSFSFDRTLTGCLDGIELILLANAYCYNKHCKPRLYEWCFAFDNAVSRKSCISVRSNQYCKCIIVSCYI